MKKFTVFILIFCFDFLNAQQKTDSLFSLLKSNPSDSIKFLCYDELCWEYMNYNTDSAMYFGEKALAISKKLNKSEKIAVAYSSISTVFYYKGKLENAIEQALKSYEIRKTLSDKTLAFKSLNNLAVMYQDIGELDKAMNLLLDADKNWTANDEIKSSVKNNLGTVYKLKGNYKEALIKFFEALALKEKGNNLKDQAMTLSNIASIYREQDNLKMARRFIDKAFAIGMKTNDLYLKSQLLDFIGVLFRKEGNIEASFSSFKESLSIKRKYGSQNLISASLLNICTSYMAVNNFREAYKFVLEAIEIKRNAKEKSGLARALNNYGIILSRLGKHNEGILAVKEALDITSKIHENEGRLQSMFDLSQIYESAGDEKQSLFWLKKTIDLRDTIYTGESQKITTEMEAKYQNEKKEKEIQLLNKDKDIQTKEIALKNTQRNGFMIGFALLLLLAIVVARGYIQKRKANKILSLQKKQIEFKNISLEKANFEINRQKQVVEEHQKEILDSIHYAKRIQNALITSEKYVARIINKLNP